MVLVGGKAVAVLPYCLLGRLRVAPPALAHEKRDTPSADGRAPLSCGMRYKCKENNSHMQTCNHFCKEAPLQMETTKITKMKRQGQKATTKITKVKPLIQM